VPIFFVNGTNDFAYPLDSYMKSHADGTLTAPKPPENTRAFFFTATSPAGLQVGSPAVIGRILNESHQGDRQATRRCPRTRARRSACPQPA
jgi:hypothetical protein